MNWGSQAPTGFRRFSGLGPSNFSGHWGILKAATELPVSRQRCRIAQACTSFHPTLGIARTFCDSSPVLSDSRSQIMDSEVAISKVYSLMQLFCSRMACAAISPHVVGLDFHMPRMARSSAPTDLHNSTEVSGAVLLCARWDYSPRHSKLQETVLVSAFENGEVISLQAFSNKVLQARFFIENQ